MESAAHPPSPRHRLASWPLLLAAAFYTVLTAFYFSPTLTELTRALAPDPGDPRFNLWVLQWDLHQLRQGLTDYWNAPIFHPLEGGTALSDHLLGPALLVWPLVAAGLTPIGAYNLLLLGCFVLSAVATCHVVRLAGASWPAAVLAGLLFSFSPFRFDHLSHLQILLIQWLPWTLWCFHRLLAAPSWGRAGVFFLFYALHVTGGTYLAYMVHFALAALAAGHWADLGRHLRDARGRWVLGVTAALCCALMVAIFLPYLVVSHRLDTERGGLEWQVFGGSLLSYGTPGGWYRFADAWPGALRRPENGLFLGFVATALAIAGLVAFCRRHRRRAPPLPPLRRWLLRGLIAVATLAWIGGELHTWTGAAQLPAPLAGIAGEGYKEWFWIFLVSAAVAIFLDRRWHGEWPLRLGEMTAWERGLLGTVLVCGLLSFPLVYSPLAEVIPGLSGMRSIPRFHFLVALALAFFMARAVDALLRRLPGRPLRAAVAAALMLLAAWELAPKPIPWWPQLAGRELDDVYRWLEGREDVDAILELPLGKTADTTLYMYFQTFHWVPMVNGYSGYEPPHYVEFKKTCCFPVPEAEALGRLRRWGVSHVVLHSHLITKRWQKERVEAFRRLPGVEEVYRRPHLQVYRIL